MDILDAAAVVGAAVVGAADAVEMGTLVDTRDMVDIPWQQQIVVAAVEAFRTCSCTLPSWQDPLVDQDTVALVAACLLGFVVGVVAAAVDKEAVEDNHWWSFRAQTIEDPAYHSPMEAAVLHLSMRSALLAAVNVVVTDATTKLNNDDVVDTSADAVVAADATA